MMKNIAMTRKRTSTVIRKDIVRVQTAAKKQNTSEEVKMTTKGAPSAAAAERNICHTLPSTLTLSRSMTERLPLALTMPKMLQVGEEVVQGKKGRNIRQLR